MKKPTCYVLFSGGLDSRLALKSMQEQSENGKKFDIIAVYFHLPFLKEVREEIKEFCKDHGIKLEIFDYSKGDLFKKYIKMIEKPKFGYGVGINPCIDCHLFIINETKKMLNDNDFICTGEVLNERPMSQYRRALENIEKDAELIGRILRPLSARLLKITKPEEQGLIDRDKLYDISGRSRKKQIELAKKYKISYPSPAGGCLLCEEVFAERLRDLFKRKKEIEQRDIELLKVGRHFFFKDYKIIVGRNHAENETIKKLRKNEKIFELKKAPGPSVLLQGEINEKNIKKAKEFVLKYSKNKDEVVER